MVSGAALADVNDATVAEIHDAWMAHCVLFFRNQALSPEQHLAFGRRFGPLHVHPAAPYAHGDPALMVIRTDAASKRNNGAGWHSDVSADAEPPLGTILHLHQVPRQGGDTLRASMYAALEALSAPMRALLERLTMHHEADCVGFTRRIKELEAHESRALLWFLFEHVKHPAFQCRFKRRGGDVAMWDNRCTQHLAVWDYHPETRAGLRVTIAGDRPFLERARPSRAATSTVS